MKKFRKQIHESFFNPLLHFLPLLAFLVVDDFYDIKTAWLVSLPISILSLVFVYFIYNKIFEWFLGSTAIFIFIVILISALSYLPVSKSFRFISAEYLVLILLVISLLFKGTIEKFLTSKNSVRFSMVNNLNEHFRMIWIFAIVFFIYIHSYLLITLLQVPISTSFQSFVTDIYLGVLFFIIIYELIRVTLIRIRLLREEWWPIVSEQGKIIGSIQSATSLKEDRKYMHPIVRVILIDNNKIFLQKRNENDIDFPGMWDTAISNHVRMTETVEACIQRTANEQFGIYNNEVKPIFLSNYVHETEFEYHYAFLFVACKLPILKLNSTLVDHAKWWTLTQIEDNLTAGIFTENFISELDILKRSGLFESDKCACECKLKETLYQQQFFIKKD